MSDLERGRLDRNNLSNKGRPLPPEVERVRRALGVDTLDMWMSVFKAAGAEEGALIAYERFRREGYVPAAVRLFCEQYEEKSGGVERNRQRDGANELPPPKSFIMGKAAIIPPDAPDHRKKP